MTSPRAVAAVADINTQFAEWLRSARLGAGLSQHKVANALRAQGFSVFRQTAVHKIEHQERPVRLDEAVAITALFGTTLDVVLGLKPDSPESFTSHALARRTDLLQQVQRMVNAELGRDLPAQSTTPNGDPR